MIFLLEIVEVARFLSDVWK